EVEISALVKMGKLADDLKSIGLILKKKQNPRVMVVLYSKMRSGSFIDISLEGNRNAENQVERMLMKRGFQLVDADQTKRRRELEDRLATGDPKSAGRLAKDYGAEILITGEVSRIFAGTRSVYGSNVRFFSNDIRMKALETDTAKILFSGYRTGPASSADALFYLEESIEELFEEMVEGIFEQWRKDVYKAGLYQVRVANVS
ncbi:MAG: hypothetical protein GY846_16280, partial [Deltaproteobacteria bacterium]|nr:hypothetical protein [Deltaproteobacteria bacterium]